MILSASDESQAEHKKADTIPPSASVRGDVLVVSNDPVFEHRALHALRDDGWRALQGTSAELIAGSLLTSDVIVIDPLGQRRTLDRVIDAIARIRLRPSLIIALRRASDLEIAVRRCVGCFDVDVPNDILRDAVLRAHVAQRFPRSDRRR